MKIARTLVAASGKRFLASAAVALSAGLALSPAAMATDDDVVTCGLKTLRGVYQFRASGFNIANGVAVPKAIIEMLVFDGQGNVLTPAVSVSVNGTILQPPQGNPGTYTVDADCTGTLTFGDGPSFDLHIAPYSKAINLLQTNPGTVMQGSAVRVLSLRAWGG
jgi:hypothetical protein